MSAWWKDTPSHRTCELPKCRNMHMMWPCHLLGTAQVSPNLNSWVFNILNWRFPSSCRFGTRGSFLLLQTSNNTYPADPLCLFRQVAWRLITSSQGRILCIRPPTALDTSSSRLSSVGMFPEISPRYCCYGGYHTVYIAVTFSSFPAQSEDQRMLNSKSINFKRCPRHKLV